MVNQGNALPMGARFFLPEYFSGIVLLFINRQSRFHSLLCAFAKGCKPDPMRYIRGAKRGAMSCLHRKTKLRARPHIWRAYRNEALCSLNGTAVFFFASYQAGRFVQMATSFRLRSNHSAAINETSPAMITGMSPHV